MLTEKLRDWLGPRGVRFFQILADRHKTIPLVVKLNAKRKHLPAWSLHNNEGMSIRNFLRKQPECAKWTDHDFDERWIPLTLCAVHRAGYVKNYVEALAQWRKEAEKVTVVTIPWEKFI